tara:strand:+ start:618 stop:1277 length:660 start_codon:yes stop_codon:yes gene_type:complete
MNYLKKTDTHTNITEKKRKSSENNFYWEIIPNVLSSIEVQQLRHIALKAKDLVLKYNKTKKTIGSPKYWRGLDMASKDINLHKYYRSYLNNTIHSKRYTKIASEYLNPLYLFNDQLVTKLPNENFSFDIHYDNQFDIGDDYNGITLMLILDDFTSVNGTIQCYAGEWVTLYPKEGDILVLNGTTKHRSSINRSKDSRSTYILHYTDGFINPRFHNERLV